MTKIWLPVACLNCALPGALFCARCQPQLEIAVRRVSRPNLPNGIAVTTYSKVSVALVHAFKTAGSSRLARLLAKPMAAAIFKHCELAGWSTSQPRPVWLVPAPSRKSEFKHRGFEPAGLLAKALAKQLQRAGAQRVSVRKMLRLTGVTQDQAALNRTGRLANLQGKMRATAWFGSEKNRPILILVDDIVTTGATILEMTRALETAGWQTETFVCFAETL